MIDQQRQHGDRGRISDVMFIHEKQQSSALRPELMSVVDGTHERKRMRRSGAVGHLPLRQQEVTLLLIPTSSSNQNSREPFLVSRLLSAASSPHRVATNDVCIPPHQGPAHCAPERSRCHGEGT